MCAAFELNSQHDRMVGANYREARRARSKPELVAKCGDRLQEADETTYWLDRQESTELTAIFVSIIKRAKGEL